MSAGRAAYGDVKASVGERPAEESRVSTSPPADFTRRAAQVNGAGSNAGSASHDYAGDARDGIHENCPEMAMKLPAGGHESCPAAAMRYARYARPFPAGYRRGSPSRLG
jgi:hypothetical protein